jgi:hypothetical protein
MDDVIGSLQSNLIDLAAQVGDKETCRPFAEAGAP